MRVGQGMNEERKKVGTKTSHDSCDKSNGKSRITSGTEVAYYVQARVNVNYEIHFHSKV